MRRLALLCLLAFVAACGGDDDDASAPSSTTSTSEAATTTTAPAERVLGEPVELDGVVMGVHPTKPIAYVSIVVPGEIGCEGGDVAHLFAQPLPGGEPVDVVAGGLDAGTVLTGGADGRVAIVDQCEGFLARLTTAQPRDDGTFADVHEVEMADDLRRTLGAIAWGADGRSFVGVVHDLPRDSGRAVRVRPDGSVESLATRDDLIAVQELAGGRLALMSPTSVTIGDAAPIEQPATSIDARPDRHAIAVAGEHGITVYDEHGGLVSTVTSEPSSVSSWSSDGRSLAYLRLNASGDASAWLDDALVSEHAGFAEPMLTADGDWILYNEAVDGGQGFAEPRGRARPIS